MLIRVTSRQVKQQQKRFQRFLEDGANDFHLRICDGTKHKRPPPSIMPSTHLFAIFLDIGLAFRGGGPMCVSSA